MDLSVIIPVYNEEEGIQNSIDVIYNTFSSEDIDFELIFIDDGSVDNSYNILKQNAENKKNLKIIKFSRNFGKEAAIHAGLKHAKGDAVIPMDADLQHPPEIALEMYRLWKLNPEIDIVEARKNSRGKENPIHTFFSNLFYRILKFLSHLDLKNASDFKLMDRRVAKSILSMPEQQTFFRAISSWVGYNTHVIYFDVPERKFGKTKWSGAALIKYAVNNITSFTDIPIKIVGILGGCFIIFAVVLSVQTLINYILGKAASGFTTVIILLLITGGFILISLGIIGHYISKIYNEVKARPKYIISDIINNDE